MPTDNLDLVSRLSQDEKTLKEHSLRCISPNDAKYGEKSKALVPYLSADAEWRAFALVQRTLLETRIEYEQAEQWNLDEVDQALEKISPLNMALLEDKVTHHDQLAVLDEIGRHVFPETKALLHPGTTSYDIVDTARSYLFKKAWNEVIRPEVGKAIDKLCNLAEKSLNMIMVGRTHLQDTSPITFGGMLAGYAARFTNRLKRCDTDFKDLRGKISGIVGTGASIEMVIGEGKATSFELNVLNKLGLKADYTATQIVQKERLADIGHSLTTLMLVLRDFANDIRILYSSAIGEVTSRDNAKRLGGSSADGLKNNPINYENIRGKAKVVESGMTVLYDMIVSDLQRDLSNSVEARYQPQQMMAETYEAFCRLNKALPQLSTNEDRMAANLIPIRENPSEAMTAILKGEGWVHSTYGTGHEFVKEMGKITKSERSKLLDTALEDSEFRSLYQTLPQDKRDILNGQLEKYAGNTVNKAKLNIDYAKAIIGR